MTPEAILELPTYGLDAHEKSAALLEVLNGLTERHAEACEGYGRILKVRGLGQKPARDLTEVPFLPVRLFKHHLLKSVPDGEVLKLLTSSGTTGQQVSRIAVDSRTSRLQTKAVVKIMQDFIGTQRLPMLIVDHPAVVKTRQSYSARGAGIIGISNFGRDHTYMFSNEDMGIGRERVDTFLRKHASKPILLFGFTFMVWQHLIRALEDMGETLPLEQGILIHSGGWKMLAEQAVDGVTFNRRLRAVTGMRRIHNFYGMVEQVGSIFVECEAGCLHAPVMADVIIRSPGAWEPLGPGQEGLIEVMSALPWSYPGHALLTEDRGVLIGEDNCPCGRKGKTFRVLGRLARAEVRGCSDAYAAEAA